MPHSKSRPPAAAKSSFGTLVEALKVAEYHLERDGASRAMVATSTLAAFQRQELPDHVRVKAKKRRGKRISVRGPRNYRLTRLVQARWPQDRQLEAAVPSLAFVLRGQADFHIADYLVECQPGDWVFIPAGISKPDASLPYVQDGSRRECDLLWIYPGPLNGVGLECFITHSTANSTQTTMQRGTAAVKNNFLPHLFNELSEQTQILSHRQQMAHLLSGIILWLTSEITEGTATIPWVRRLDQPVPRSHNLSEEARKYIESHLNHSLTIPEMARLLAVSPATFTRQFRADTGQSFHQYLTAQRLKGAENLLQDTDLSVNSVALKVGLSYERLRDLFNVNHGCSPGEFRKTRI